MYKKVNIILFSLILLLAVFLRFYQINNFPPSLNWDEVSLGYNAYSIFKTGKDEWGQFLPLSFRAFGDYKLPLYIYADAPFVAIFGLNEVSVRLPSILAGIGVVVLIFLILQKLTGSFYLAAWGMFIAAILPWLVIFSRIALEANLALFLTLAAFYFLILAQRKKYSLLYSALLLGLSIFTYNSARILVLPFLLLAAIFFGSGVANKKELVIALIILSGFISVAFGQALTVDSSVRYRWITILDEGAITKINQLRGLSDLPLPLNQLVYNKATYFAVESFKNYSSYFNPVFLFFEGGSNYQFSVPGSGLVYLIMLPLIALGFWQMIKQREKWQLFILGWLLIAPIPGAITRDAPHALRTIFLAIPLIILAVMGIRWSQNFLGPKIFRLIAVLTVFILIVSTYSFWQTYTEDYSKNYSQAWQYGYKQAVKFAKENLANYDQIIFTKKYGEPHEFVLFYLQYDPYKYQTDKNLIRYNRSDWFWVDCFDKFMFVNDWEIKEKIAGLNNALLITSAGNYPPNSHRLGTINFLDGKIAFEIVELR